MTKETVSVAPAIYTLQGENLLHPDDSATPWCTAIRAVEFSVGEIIPVRNSTSNLNCCYRYTLQGLGVTRAKRSDSPASFEIKEILSPQAAAAHLLKSKSVSIPLQQQSTKRPDQRNVLSDEPSRFGPKRSCGAYWDTNVTRFRGKRQANVPIPFSWLLPTILP